MWCFLFYVITNKYNNLEAYIDYICSTRINAILAVQLCCTGPMLKIELLLVNILFSRIKMKVAMLFPKSESCRFISAKLLETAYAVTFYCPDKVDLDWASNMIFELNVLGKEQDELRSNDESSFNVAKDNNLEDCDFIGENLLL